MKLAIEKRPLAVMHKTVSHAQGTTHDGFVFQDVPHRQGRISGEIRINKSLIEEKGNPVSIEIVFEKEIGG